MGIKGQDQLNLILVETGKLSRPLSRAQALRVAKGIGGS
jgi:hypothetical protein